MNVRLVEPYRIEIAEAELDDLRDRLARTRWPERETADDWSQGVPLACAQMTGVDLTPKAVAHAQAAHHEANLRFVKGDAENLPFGAGTFDAVVNVESSHGYPSMHRFLTEVHRVLRPDGLLLFADVRSPEDTESAPRAVRRRWANDP